MPLLLQRCHCNSLPVRLPAVAAIQTSSLHHTTLCCHVSAAPYVSHGLLPLCPCPKTSCTPQYSTQGFHPEKWQDLTTTLDGPEVKIFKEACKKNKVSKPFVVLVHVSVLKTHLHWQRNTGNDTRDHQHGQDRVFKARQLYPAG